MITVNIWAMCHKKHRLRSLLLSNQKKDRWVTCQSDCTAMGKSLAYFSYNFLVAPPEGRETGTVQENYRKNVQDGRFVSGILHRFHHEK